jgi:hypothetical protein
VAGRDRIPARAAAALVVIPTAIVLAVPEVRQLGKVSPDKTKE